MPTKERRIDLSKIVHVEKKLDVDEWDLGDWDYFPLNAQNRRADIPPVDEPYVFPLDIERRSDSYIEGVMASVK